MPAPPTMTRRGLLATAAVASLATLAGCTSATARDPAAAPRRSSRPSRGSASPRPALAARLPSRAGDVLETTVTILGTGLDTVSGVVFGTSPAVLVRRSPTTLTVTIPAAPDYQPATVPVTLQASGTSLDLGSYAYQATSPVGKQMAYALKYWRHYNTAVYGNLNPVGGDCADFVSQTLIARGWTMNDVWYDHDAGAHWSPVWGYVPAMDDYFLSHGARLGLERFDESRRSDVALGDIGVFDWADNGDRDHIEVVDRITVAGGTTKIALASHNLDYAYRDLDETLTVQHPGATMHFWHFTDPLAVGGFPS